ncbi:cytochrome b5-like heme/steroid binding domain-containing protein [Xylaria bambusicola]|uniref:cytochrome b5-like heme/steroid binding domain-containing protein n=1 Tax=Xylaria bambusicola TaxID=326684 RepID=UPI002007632F|nr:cytochrome b5-like heme/steroid binding domain-containing protein [Xylaria bambusicola]KAI0521836.1 cytochrome b5-like heme/steroid binding domain-containing protein [Xylaria bambusicola]
MAGKFEPKAPVNLDPPKDDPITLEELAQADGTEGRKAYVAIKASHRFSQAPLHRIEIGKIYDVTGNKMYAPGAGYNVFVGKDASRALAMTSTKPEDVKPEWRDLPDNQQKVLNDWAVEVYTQRIEFNSIPLINACMPSGLIQIA